jgi:hypothetical protein
LDRSLAIEPQLRPGGANPGGADHWAQPPRGRVGGIPEFSGGFPGDSAMLPRDAAPFPRILKETAPPLRASAAGASPRRRSRDRLIRSTTRPTTGALTTTGACWRLRPVLQALQEADLPVRLRKEHAGGREGLASRSGRCLTSRRWSEQPIQDRNGTQGLGVTGAKLAALSDRVFIGDALQWESHRSRYPGWQSGEPRSGSSHNDP